MRQNLKKSWLHAKINKGLTVFYHIYQNINYLDIIHALKPTINTFEQKKIILVAK